MLISNYHACQYIENVGTDEQKWFFYQKMLDGARLGNASSESGGRHSYDFKTTLIADGNYVILNGEKAYATGAIDAHYNTVVAKDEEDRVVMVLVERDAPGLEFINDWDGFGQRLTTSHSVILKNVRVPAFHVFDTWKGGDLVPPAAVTQLAHAGIDLGIAKAAWRDTLTYLREKARPWKASGIDCIKHDPLVLEKVGNLSLRLDTAEVMLERASVQLDHARAEPSADNIAVACIAVSQAKILSTEAALQATNELFQLGGASSTRTRYGYDRHWRNARTHTTHDPVHWRYHTIGNFVLNAISPVQTGAV
ncbi:acyl-CoA dehydrogenase family protein [Enterobacter ludwigii]|uniref:acyl-CoA dehydrogenase family protein n=1 Tax=Enterobacter ludwigii TaxID=299767 RepID=UPI001C8B6F7A|nr:acyl-CoA dehydrogenase family protein [Enterobacter ludwigii]EES0032880.1 SfnB family sulfur acquisition oxidoreductase [Escherichia coli]EKS6730695.1 acyl-CoA dehydrogenase family protein [Enterobacter mori]MBX8911069.1 SfnB family sulfur acquisition oxidoreductase [Enterobacter ludwigii]MCM7781935.1 acyl-CoA dehydrogenase family protein [Enterobacter ludwigii]